MKMKIPTKEILERLDSRLVGGIAGPIALDAIDTINAQAKEIEELQAVIVRLREERVADMIDGDIELEKNNG